MSFLQEFTNLYKPLLGKRAASFQLVFEELEKKANKGETLQIIETGCVRSIGNWEGDGQSSFMFGRFVEHYPLCKLDIYDISPNATNTCAKVLESNTNIKNIKIHTQDSVQGLWEFSKHVDVLYLDSYDVDFDNPHPSAFHHIQELCAIMKCLKPEALIIVDDNINNTGKGQYISTFLTTIGAEKIYDGYQIVFKLPKFKTYSFIL